MPTSTSRLPASLAETLRALCFRTPDTTVAVAVEHLGSGETLGINDAEVFHPASTIKVALLAAVYARAAAGGAETFSLDDRIPIRNAFTSSIDGSPFELSASDDSEPTMYAHIGTGSETVRELARLAIVRSSNLGTNLLLDLVSPAEVTALMHSIGATDLLLRNRMMDLKAFREGKTNRGTARGLCRMMSAVARHELPGAPQMLDVLFAQHFVEGIPAGVPAGTRVANKTGSITAHYHDVGVVYPRAETGRAPYAVAVLTRGFQNDPDAHAVVADISRAVYGALT